MISRFVAKLHNYQIYFAKKWDALGLLPTKQCAIIATFLVVSSTTTGFSLISTGFASREVLNWREFFSSQIKRISSYRYDNLQCLPHIWYGRTNRSYWSSSSSLKSSKSSKNFVEGLRAVQSSNLESTWNQNALPPRWKLHSSILNWKAKFDYNEPRPLWSLEVFYQVSRISLSLRWTQGAAILQQILQVALEQQNLV